MAANGWLVGEARHYTSRLVVCTGQGDGEEMRRSLEVDGCVRRVLPHKGSLFTDLLDIG